MEDHTLLSDYTTKIAGPSPSAAFFTFILFNIHNQGGPSFYNKILLLNFLFDVLARSESKLDPIVYFV